MFQSNTFRYFLVGFMAWLMCIPMFFVSEIVNERSRYSNSTTRSLSQEWGGPQNLNGPLIIIPVTRTVKDLRKVPIKDPVTGVIKTTDEGTIFYKEIEEERIEAREPLYILPNKFAQNIITTSEERQRGIFKVPVYRASAQQSFDFDLTNVAKSLIKGEVVDWDRARFVMGVTKNKSLRGVAKLVIDGNDYALEPRDRKGGLYSDIGDPRNAKAYKLTFDFLGAQRLSVAPAGRENTIKITSDWPHPSFDGAFLPDDHTITETGFEATWEIPHFARTVAQIGRQSPEEKLAQTASFGLKFFQPNDFYKQAYRASRYGLLFIALTFLTILLMDERGGRVTSSVQYVMIGLAQAVFVLLMVAFAEHIGFNAAYLTASIATITLITLYALVGLKLGKRSGVVCFALVLLYAVLYLILQSTDYALLAGSILCFAAIAAVMFATRNEEWNTNMAQDMLKSWAKPKQKPDTSA